MPSSDPKLKKFFFTYDGDHPEKWDDGIKFAEEMCKKFLDAKVKSGRITITKAQDSWHKEMAKNDHYAGKLVKAGWCAIEYLCDEWDYVCEIIESAVDDLAQSTTIAETAKETFDANWDIIEKEIDK